MNTRQIQRITENLVNGNLTDAKQQAKRVSYAALKLALVSGSGWSESKATAAASYLKNASNETFQQYCDAK
jgi:hypothetical protein